MRMFLVLSLVGLISGAGLGWWPETEDESAEMEEALRLKAEAALGIRRMLRGHGGFDFDSVVVGRVLDGGDVDFRGQVLRKGRAEAAWGRVVATCADGLAAPGCWKLTHLEAGGDAVDLAASFPQQLPGPAGHAAQVDPAAASIAAPMSAPITASMSASETALATSSASISAAPVNFVSKDTFQQPQASGADAAPGAKARPAATHKVARPVINTRSGPGTDNPVLARLNAGARLALIDTSGGWGNFVILDGKAGGTEVWAALSLLEDATR